MTASSAQMGASYNQKNYMGQGIYNFFKGCLPQILLSLLRVVATFH